MKIAFRPVNAIPVGASFRIYFPVRSQENEDLYDQDLGYGLPSGSQIPCNTRELWSVDSGYPTYTLTCILTHGSKNTNTHAMVTLTGGWTSSLNTGTLYEFEIAGHIIPNVAADNRHVEMIMEVFNGGTLLNSGIAYDFSVKANPAIITGVYTTPSPTASTSVAYDSGVTYKVQFNIVATSVSLESTQPYDYWILEFP